MTSPDPDRLVKCIYAERAKQEGINQRWEKLPDYRQDYWRVLVNLFLAVQERLRAEEVRG
jgi:hypothetical protein